MIHIGNGDHQVPPRIVRRLRHQYGIDSAQPIVAGMSGAVVFQCAASGDRGGISGGDVEDAPSRVPAELQRRYALRRWPIRTDSHRIDEVHRVMKTSRAAGCHFVPKIYTIAATDRAASTAKSPQTFAAADGAYHWDLTSWVPGNPIACNASLDRISLGAEAIGAFHDSVLSLGSRHQRPPAILIRQKRVIDMQNQIAESLKADLGRHPPVICDALKRANELLRQKWPLVHKEISRSLDQLADTPVVTQCVLRDVHREHVLFTRSAVTGLVDFDAVRVDTPLTDLVRWASGFMLGRDCVQDVWDAVLAGYRCSSPSFKQENQSNQLDRSREMMDTIHRSSLWISLANWSRWIGVEAREFGCGDDVVVARINYLTSLADSTV